VTWLPPVQTPVTHVSVCVQAFPSEHDVPSALVGFEHTPLVGSHVPTAWHWSLAVQVTAVPAQIPAAHWSAVVHAFPSLQAVPFGADGFVQAPVAGLHVPTAWHWSLDEHVTAEPAQIPAVHWSAVVHAFPSLHTVPFGADGFVHAPVAGLHAPAAWH
jgi:hypothetical protein